MLKRFTSALARLTGGAEPRHDGQTARWWAARLEHDDAAARQSAAEAFGGMGPPAIPALMAALADRSLDKRRARRLAAGLAAIRPDGMQMLFRALAADPQHPALIEAYREIIAGRVEDLIPLMRGDADMRDTLVDWLRNEGARIIPTLLFFAADDSFDVRFGILSIILRMLQAGTPMPPAVNDRLIQALGDPEPPARAAAAAALGFAADRAAPATATLMAGLADENAKMRLACAKTLGAIGPAAVQALPALLAFEDDLLLAAQSAGRVAAGGASHHEHICGRFSPPEFALHRAVALAWAGAPENGTLADLMAALKEDNQDRATHAVKAIGALGPAAGDALPVLARLRRERPFDGALEWPLHEAILSVKKKSKD